MLVLCTGIAVSQPPPGGGGSVEVPGGGAADGPTGTVTIGPVGVEKGSVRVDSTWDKCGNDASKAHTILYKGSKDKQADGELANEWVTMPAGNKGKDGGDFADAKKLKSGDKCFAVFKVYDKDSKVIVEKVAGDFTVP